MYYSFSVVYEHKQYFKIAAIKYIIKNIYILQLVIKPQMLLVVLGFVVYIHSEVKC